MDGFVRRTFTAMIEGVRLPAIAAGLATAETFDAGIRALHRTAERDGTFCYTFFRATARVAWMRMRCQVKVSSDLTGGEWKLVRRSG